MERSHEVMLRLTRTLREKSHVVLERPHQDLSRLTRTAGGKSHVVFWGGRSGRRKICRV